LLGPTRPLKRRRLRAIAAELAAIGHLGPSRQPYYASSIRHMLAAKPEFPSNYHTCRRHAGACCDGLRGRTGR
jgi:hypothetical protein